MKIEIYYEPVFHIIIRDVFTKKENKQILKEALSLEDKFVDSYIGNNKKQNKEFRSNKSAFYDEIYNDNRNKSVLLKKIDKILSNDQITEILGSSEYPFTDFGNTNTHETQVSRYGEDQKYNWHIDAVQARQRTISFVYWFHDIPKKFTGGELQITKSPIYDGELMGSGEVKTVEPDNNTMIIFSSNNSHRVINAKSPKAFKDGRFSVNCWVGIR